MSLVDEIRKVWAEARPLIEEQMAIAEKLAAMRDVASDKGIDWSQLKALIKATIADENSGKTDDGRVAKLLEKASAAEQYADLLGLTPSNLTQNNFSPVTGEVHEAAPEPASKIAVAAPYDRDKELADTVAGMQALRA